MIVTPKEAAKLLKTNQNIVYQLLENGEIPAFKMGTAWKIPEQTLREWIVNRANEEAAARREINNV